MTNLADKDVDNDVPITKTTSNFSYTNYYGSNNYFVYVSSKNIMYGRRWLILWQFLQEIGGWVVDEEESEDKGEKVILAE